MIKILSAYGGAIYNNYQGTIGDITGDFIGNYALGNFVYGGAIYNNRGTIGDITGDFIGNFANNEGGAINNLDTAFINELKGNFIGNHALYHGGAISNSGSIGDITANFMGNYLSTTSSVVSGGAIYSFSGTIGDITGDFIGNYAVSTNSYARGGAIFNGYDSIINDITGDFIGNYVTSTDDYAQGGAIYNEYGTIGVKDDEGKLVGGLINSSFINNYAKSETGEAKGGAIYTNKSLNIIAQNGGQSVFSGNYVQDKDGKRQEAIYVNNNISAGNIKTEYVSVDLDKIIYQEKNSNYDTAKFPELTLNANTNGVIRFDDQISGNGDSVLVKNTYQSNFVMAEKFPDNIGITAEQFYELLKITPGASTTEVVNAYVAYSKEMGYEISQEEGMAKLISMGIIATSDPELISSESKGGYDLRITGDSTGKVILNNKIINANISVDNTNVYVNEGTNLAESKSLAVNSGVLNINHLANQTINFEKFSNAGNINLASVDVDLAKESMGRITAKEYGDSSGTINVQGLNLLSDATKDTTSIQFADEQIAGSVSYTGATPIAYSPIWKYDVSYNPDDGFFTFTRGAASSGNASDAFNPSVLASPVATQAGAYTTQLQTFNYAFQHADTFMNIPYLERVAIINQGKYALSPTGDATDVGTYSPLLLKEESAGFWVKPYASFENVPLKNGPKVSNINYGTLVGYDSPLQSISNGFERVLTGYIGYNGASQRYSGVDAYQNGGLLGGTATFYKGNFFNATTLSVGASAGDASTMYGSENYTMLLAGLGNKTGYNFEFFNGGMILQPSMLISYTFVNTFDYTNGAGVRIESDPMHAIQLAPGIKLIGNTKNGWQPYIGVSMIWNLLDESKVTADSVRLPEMSIKPYVQYGVGLQKRVNDKFLAFGQAMIHNGGRNGVSLSAGLRW